jgi:hypothetical protein
VPLSVEPDDDDQAADEVRARRRRSERFARRSTLWRASKLKRVRGCGRWTASNADAVSVVLNDARAHYAGLQSCGSIWSCPVCSAKVRQRRSEEIELAASVWLAMGGKLVAVALTVRHGQGDSLSTLLDAILKGWQRGVVAGGAWKAEQARFGIAGWVRSVEVTYGHANGWHPHIHGLLFVSGDVDAGDVEKLAEGIRRRWGSAVVRYGAGLPDDRNCVIELVSDAKAASEYLAKLQDGASRLRSAALEIARGDLKVGRTHDAARWLPMELLDAVQDGEAWAMTRWVEYETATRGRRAITWSRGLRSLLDVGPEASDEEVAAEEVGGEVVATIPAETWARIVRTPALVAGILEAAEDGGELAVWSLIDGARSIGPPRVLV